MTSTVFSPYVTPVPSTWLNDINNHTYSNTPISPATTVHPANVVGYTPSGTGAVATTVQSKLRESVSVLDFATVAGAIAASSGRIYFPAGTYDLGTTTLVIPNSCRIVGAGRGVTTFTYSGTGVAFDGSGSSDLGFEEFTLTCSNDAAIGIKLGGAAQHIKMDNVAISGSSGASNTGTGLLLDATSTTNAFSGQLSTNLLYVLGFKYGVRFVGQSVVKTWTTCSFNQTFLIGRGVGIITGSIGFSVGTDTNLSGSSFIGGTVEGFDIGLNVALCSFASNSGIEWDSDIEACNTSYIVGDTFQGRINLNPAAKQYKASTNGTANVWTKELSENGVVTRESYYSQNSVIYNPTSGWNYYNGVSKILNGSYSGGGVPTLVWGVDGNGNFSTLGTIRTTGTSISQASTVGGVTVTSAGARVAFSIPNNKTMTFAPYFGQLFMITIGATGEAGVFFSSYASNVITSLGPLPTSIELSATPLTNHIGIFKSANSNIISVKSGLTASGLTNMSISIIGDGNEYSLPTDWV